MQQQVLELDFAKHRDEIPVAPQLSVVIPARDEEACLPLLWDRLQPVLEALEPAWEVIFVDDGSGDRSDEALARIAAGRNDVRILRMTTRQGQSAALDAGFRASRGKWVVTLDADLQNPPEEIPRLLGMAEGADLVYGRRRKREDGWVTRVASRVANAVRNGITGHRVRDAGCSLKLFRREALSRIPVFVGMHRFLPTLFEFHGFEIREIEVAHAPRAAGASKYGIFDRAWRGLVDCLAVRWMRRRCLRYEIREMNGDRDA